MTTQPDYSKVSKFCFTYAMPDGAWLEWKPVLTSGGMVAHKEWVSFKVIISKLGELWLDRQMKKQGWMTGCWIEVC